MVARAATYLTGGARRHSSLGHCEAAAPQNENR
jgi:hypothetical protein